MDIGFGFYMSKYIGRFEEFFFLMTFKSKNAKPGFARVAHCRKPFFKGIFSLFLGIIPSYSNTMGGNCLENTPVRIWKRYIPLLIDLLISNNFSSMTFFCATRILRVIGRQSKVYNDVCIDATTLSDHLRATDGHLQTFALLTTVDWNK